MGSKYLIRGNHLAYLRKCCMMHEWVEAMKEKYEFVGTGFTTSMVQIHPGRLRTLRSSGLIAYIPGYWNPARYTVLPVCIEWYHRKEGYDPYNADY